MIWIYCAGFIFWKNRHRTDDDLKILMMRYFFVIAEIQHYR